MGEYLIMICRSNQIFIILLILTSFLVNCSAGNECYKEGKTWGNDKQKASLRDIDLRQCASAFAFGFGGFTWFYNDSNKDIGNCILFDEEPGETHTCQNCISVYFAEENSCYSQKGQCQIEENNFLLKTNVEEPSDWDCYLECLVLDKCFYYTWYRGGNWTQDTCY